MGLKRRLFTAAAVVCAAAAVAAIGLSGKTVSQEQEETIFSKSKDTIFLVYGRGADRLSGQRCGSLWGKP